MNWWVILAFVLSIVVWIACMFLFQLLTSLVYHSALGATTQNLEKQAHSAYTSGDYLGALHFFTLYDKVCAYVELRDGVREALKSHQKYPNVSDRNTVPLCQNKMVIIRTMLNPIVKLYVLIVMQL